MRYSLPLALTLAVLVGHAAMARPLTQSSQLSSYQFQPARQQNGYGNSNANTNTNSNANGNTNFRQAMPPSGDNFDQRLANIDAMIKERMVSCNVPGYSIGIIRNGQVVFEKCYGYADIDQHTPVTNDTIFGLASVTKTFTGVTLVSLIENGLVGIDDPLEKYIDGLTKPYQSLTIRQLASMAAGVPEKVNPEVNWKEQLDILDHTPLVSEPGSQYLYSNFSYRLLGDVIAKASGKRYLEMVNETILAPLQMRNTSTTVLLQPTGLVAQGYSLNKAGRLMPVEYKNPAVSYSAGMLATNCNDMLKYALGLMSRRMLSEHGYKTLWYDRPALTTGQANPWAFGWKAGPNANIGGQHQVFWGGATQGVGSIIIILPESNCAVVALSSLRTPEVHEIGKTAMRMAFGPSGTAAPPEAPTEEQSGSSE